MDYSAILKQLGFTENVSTIYLRLLKIGKCRASVILRETGLQRSVVYNALEELTQRGLVSKTTERGVSIFSANNPDSLVSEAEDKRRFAEKAAEELKKYQSVTNREAIVLEGDDIVQRVAEKTLELENGSTVYFLGPSKFGNQSNMERFWKRYHEKRIALGLSCKILYDRDTSEELLTARNQLSSCEARYLPFGVHNPMWMVIFGDHVAMVVPGDEPPLAFIIKSNQTALGFQNYFNYLWKQ